MNALRQSVHGHLPKDLRKLTHTLLGHLAPPPCVKCANSPCLNLGGQSMAQTSEPALATRGVSCWRIWWAV